MIALLGMFLTVGIFIGGYVFAMQGFWGALITAVFVIAMGTLVAAAETRGFQGQYVAMKEPPYRWDAMWADLWRLTEHKGGVLSKEPLYVQTVYGTLPITGVFSARMNGENALVFDLTPTIEETPLTQIPEML